jgi:hypothetical protein
MESIKKSYNKAMEGYMGNTYDTSQVATCEKTSVVGIKGNGMQQAKGLGDALGLSASPEVLQAITAHPHVVNEHVRQHSHHNPSLAI